MIKIGIVLATPPTFSETFLVSKIRGLREYGFDVTVFVDKKSVKTDKQDKIITSFSAKSNRYLRPFLLIWSFLYSFTKKPKTTTRYLRKLKNEQLSNLECAKRLLRNAHIISHKRVDVLHFGFITLSVGREFVAESIGAKMTTSIRGFDIAIYPLKNPGVLDLTLRKLDAVHSISEDLKQKLLSHNLSSSTRVSIIPPAIDVTKFKVEETPDFNQLSFLTVSRLHWKKGIDLTLIAIKTLVEQGIDVKYTIIGAGPEYEKLIFEIHDLDLESHVTLKGKIPHSQVKKEMSKHPYFIQYSLQEGFCNTVLEAQALGRICIVSDAEGLSENVLHERTGYVVPRRNPTMLTKQIISLLNMSEEEKVAMSVEASRRVADKFNLPNQNKEFFNFFRAVNAI